MQLLKDALETVMAETTFDLGKINESHGGTRITYTQNPDEVVSPDELRALASNSSRDDGQSMQVRRAKLIISDDAFSSWLATLHDMFEDYIDIETGNIGHAFPLGSSPYGYSALEPTGIMSQGHMFSMDDLAKELIHELAFMGIERMADMVSHWVEEQSVIYRTSAILNGLYLSEDLNPLPGIRIESLPRTTDGDFGSVHISRRNSIEDYLGRTVLSIESIASPAFFRPEGEGGRDIVKARFASDIGMDNVCQALALESNNSVEMAFQWNDYGEDSLFFGPMSRSFWSTNRGGMEAQGVGFAFEIDFRTGVKSISISEENIAHISEATLRDLISNIAKHKQKHTDVAISRWRKSIESFNGLADQFTDLRIALEALYLNHLDIKYRGEMRFRLALCGAWHLGADVEERKTIQKTFLAAYDMGSSAVHGGTLDYSAGNRSLLAEGQRLCRLGILKMLEEGPPVDWSGLILGADDSKVKIDKTA